MESRTTGIILRTRPLTETSLIVQWLTAEYGRIATVARGARRPKSPFRGKLDLFYVCDFSFVRSRSSQLHPLREAILRETHSHLRKDLQWLEQASYAAALVEQTTETDTPLEGCYGLYTGFIKALAGEPPRAPTVFGFEMKLLAELGLQPNIDGSRLTAGSRAILRRLNELDWSDLARVKPSPVQVKEIGTFLQDHLENHFSRIDSGRGAALVDD